MNVGCAGEAPVPTDQHGANPGQHVDGEWLGVAVKRRHTKATRAVIEGEAFVENALTVRQ